MFVNYYTYFIAESLRRKDEIIKQALTEKLSLVSSILNIPKTQTEEISDASFTPEHLPKELISSAMDQSKKINKNIYF